MRREILICLLLAGAATLRAADPLAEGFAHPPASARPWVYWYFMDGHLTREGVTADLEAMKKAGLGGAIFMEVDLGIPRGPVGFMSPEWQDLFAHAMHEADRLGIQIALGAGPGWCGTGGPWIGPELAMQQLVASETNVTGPGPFSARLPRPWPRELNSGITTLPPALHQQWQDFYRDVAVLAFRTPKRVSWIEDVNEKALYLRESFSSKPGVKPFLPAPAEFPAEPADGCIDQSRVADLTARLSADGQLKWDVPPGDWTIMRFGRTLTGQTTRPAPQPGVGFESDKFDPAALDAHAAAFIEKLLARTGPHTNASGGLTMLHFDSWEMGAQNWSPNFGAEFRQRRGYDLTGYLPVFTSHVVGSREISERFLWDVRRTAQELVVDNHAGRLARLAHAHGLTLSVEPYDMNPAGDLTLGRVADVPQGEFWRIGFKTFFSVLEAASIAHTCGRPLVAAEAFTSSADEAWTADPAYLKTLGDWAFCAGANRFAIHRFQAQPWNDRRPGMTMGDYGVHWDRTQTWWDLVPAYHEYLARCQFLLQRGAAVADVCLLAPEGAPQVFQPPGSAVTGLLLDHSGYNFDGCAPETLIERAQVEQGKLVFPGGTTYAILVLPAQPTMTPKLLHKIAALVRDGATVFGPPPVKSPSLEDFPQCDQEIKSLAAELWGDCDGKRVFAHAAGRGRVLWRETTVQPGEAYGDYAAVTNELAEMNLPPDFAAAGPIFFTHRREGSADIYFVANRTTETVETKCRFRVTGRQPELFDPVAGTMRALPDFSEEEGRTVLPLRFEPAQSFFVVFRTPVTTQDTAAGNFHPPKFAGKLDGPWEVSFDPKWGGPERIVFDGLEDWSQRPEPGIRFYSGTAWYRKTFEVSNPAWITNRAAHVFLNLGAVKNLARVELNGRDLGVLWCPRWRVDITGVLQAGKNRLVVEVANLWPNRLIGDLSLPAAKRFAWTTSNPFKKDSPLWPSGLLGPVTIQIEPAAARE